MLGLVGRSRKGTLRREALLVDAVGDGGRDGRREGADEGAEARVGEEAAVGERPAGGGVGAAEGGGGCHRNWARAGRSSRVSDDTRA